MLCRCGSKGNTSAVWSYVVVQENIAILTQSTRRYIGSVLEINVTVPRQTLILGHCPPQHAAHVA